MADRSPFIFWLLMAATLSVDALAFYASIAKADYWFPFIIFNALVLSQVSVVCIWAAFHTTNSFWSRITPLVMVTGAITVTVLQRLANQVFSFADLAETSGLALAHYGIHTSMLLSCLWLLQRTSYWRQRSGKVVSWQFSLASLLVATTVVAILTATTRSIGIFEREPLPNIIFICSSVALGVVSPIVWIVSMHWILRLAGILGFAILLGIAFTQIVELSHPQVMTAHYLIQGIVLSTWLSLGPVLPTPVER
jgi:hypothetical protein